MVNLVIALPENTYNEVLEDKDASNTIIYEAIKDGCEHVRGKNRWVRKFTNDHHIVYACPVCENRVRYKANFCDNCGADMREGRR